MTSAGKCRLVHQVARPQGRAAARDFAFREEDLSAPAPGAALVENVYLSVDPYMRGCMDGDWALNAPLEGRTIGRVVESRDPGLTAGQLVFHRKGWRTHALVSAAEVRVLAPAPGVPLSAYLGILGGTGLSAYVALTRIALLKKGETVFISAAGGGVGTAAGQIARLLGAGRVIGSAGSAAKVKHLTERLGFDAAFDYHEGPIAESLARAAPGGLDVYVDNVGGSQLEAAIGAMRARGRIACVGAVAQYQDRTPPAGPRNLRDVVGKSLRLEGFLVRDYNQLQGELEETLIPHIRSGRLGLEQTVLEGFDRVVDGFLGMLDGKNVGKMIVRVAAE